MRISNWLFFTVLLFSISAQAKNYNMHLTFIDGYNNKVISEEKVRVRIDNLDWSEEFTTNKEGSIDFSFDTEHFIKYSFQFESGNYQFQIRERYLGEQTDIDLTFEMYPSKKYEKSIAQSEAEVLQGLKDAPKDLEFGVTKDKIADVLTEMFIDENIQLPYWYGDYGFKVEFLVQAVFGPTGKVYQVEILESSDHHLNEEITRLVRLIPESEVPLCTEDYKMTVQFPIVIDHRMDFWEE